MEENLSVEIAWIAVATLIGHFISDDGWGALFGFCSGWVSIYAIRVVAGLMGRHK